MKNNLTKKKASAYLKEIIKFFARTTAFGIVGFIEYNNASTDPAGILYDLTVSQHNKEKLRRLA